LELIADKLKLKQYGSQPDGLSSSKPEPPAYRFAPQLHAKASEPLAEVVVLRCYFVASPELRAGATFGYAAAWAGIPNSPPLLATTRHFNFQTNGPFLVRISLYTNHNLM